MRERKIAGAPISWGVSEVPNWGAQLSPDRVLDEAQRLGFRAMEAGPPGFLPSDAAAAARTLDAHGLRCIGGFVTAVVHDRARRDAELASVERQAAWLHAAGAELLVLAAATGRDGYEERRELSDAEWTTLFETLPLIEAIATAARLTVAVHPHVGTVIEQPRDVERLLARSHVSLCLDTGHVFVGGGDPAGVARAAGRRVRHVHLKDADAALSAAVRERRLSYAAAVQQGLYRPLGDGDAGISQVLTELRSIGYDGWYVLEQDVALKDDKADPLPAIERSFMFVSARV
ncbi:MAG TPA: inosose dehydratase [Chloroflexi bacterium]|jgi:inosose dehydratase|nr:inosose dehydratase [Chloroflexota bacterium]HAL25956.1 inosose dehydratase [Chloroflexota bacterium]